MRPITCPNCGHPIGKSGEALADVFMSFPVCDYCGYLLNPDDF